MFLNVPDEWYCGKLGPRFLENKEDYIDKFTEELEFYMGTRFQNNIVHFKRKSFNKFCCECANKSFFKVEPLRFELSMTR